METKIQLLTKAEMKKALKDANCPPDLIDRIGQDLSLWWKAGWIQEILLAQKQAGIRKVVEWLYGHPYYSKIFGQSPFEWQAKLKEWGLNDETPAQREHQRQRERIKDRLREEHLEELRLRELQEVEGAKNHSR